MATVPALIDRLRRAAMGAVTLLWLSTGCGQDCVEPSLCDIRQAACQQQVMQAVACMRGSSSIDLPEVQVMDEEQLRRFLEERPADETESTEQPAQSAAEIEGAFERVSRGLALLSLSPADYSRADAADDRVSQIAALYRPSSKEIVVVDRGQALDDKESVVVFAHESVHAMQDAELDLEAYTDSWATTYDEQLAVSAIIEGEAVLYELLTMLTLDGVSLQAQLRWDRVFDQWRTDTLKEADGDDAPLIAARWRFPYAFGGGYVTQHWLARGRVGVDQLFEHPPRSTAQVMFGTPAQDVIDATEALQPFAVPALGDNYELLDGVTAGAWIARIYAARRGLAGSSLEPARALLADKLTFHYDEAEDRVVTAWRVKARGLDMQAAWRTPGSFASFRGWRSEGEHDAYIVVGEADGPVGSAAAPIDATALVWTALPNQEDDDEPAATARFVDPRLARPRPGCRRFYQPPRLPH